MHGRLLDNAVQLGSDQLRPLLEVAREMQVTIVCGIDERDEDTSRATLYNSVITISPQGTVQNCHRKLMPTNPERMVWGFGDASGIKIIDTPVGRGGSLVCWENYMPLARYAMFAQGIDIYIAPTYDSGDRWLRTSDLPADFPEVERLYPDEEEWINSGDSVIISPAGEIVAGPLRQETGLLLADIELSDVNAARRSLDIVGHYARPNIFSL